MKKTIAIVICLVLFFSISGCGKQINNQVETSKHAITYELGGLAESFIQIPTCAECGENVEIKTEVLYDADIHVFVDGQEIMKTHDESDDWGYVFVMPDHDVLVTAKPYTKEEIWGIQMDRLNVLKETYPEYFDLPAMKGLEVYVWQMAPNSYSFGLLMGTNRSKTFEELWNLKGVSAEDMRIILSTYDIDESYVSIIPWQNPFSSYIPEEWIMQEDEDPDSAAQHRQVYIDRIREMLLGAPDESRE